MTPFENTNQGTTVINYILYLNYYNRIIIIIKKTVVVTPHQKEANALAANDMLIILKRNQNANVRNMINTKCQSLLHLQQCKSNQAKDIIRLTNIKYHARITQRTTSME
jgi:hypothetical protein